MMIMGASHHFLRAFKKSHSSLNKLNFAMFPLLKITFRIVRDLHAARVFSSSYLR